MLFTFADVGESNSTTHRELYAVIQQYAMHAKAIVDISLCQSHVEELQSSTKYDDFKQECSDTLLDKSRIINDLGLDVGDIARMYIAARSQHETNIRLAYR